LPTAPRSVVFGEIHSVFEAALIGSGKWQLAIFWCWKR
jgi:hypothetical protein